jgi:hypothetical protein
MLPRNVGNKAVRLLGLFDPWRSGRSIVPKRPNSEGLYYTAAEAWDLAYFDVSRGVCQYFQPTAGTTSRNGPQPIPYTSYPLLSPLTILSFHLIYSELLTSSSFAYGPYSLTSTFFTTTAHTDLSSAFFLHLLTYSPYSITSAFFTTIAQTDLSSAFFLHLLTYSPYSLTSTSFTTIAHTDLSSTFFLHLLTPIDFRSFSVQSNLLNFGISAFLLPSGFPRTTSELLTVPA